MLYVFNIAGTKCSLRDKRQNEWLLISAEVYGTARIPRHKYGMSHMTS